MVSASGSTLTLSSRSLTAMHGTEWASRGGRNRATPRQLVVRSESRTARDVRVPRVRGPVVLAPAKPPVPFRDVSAETPDDAESPVDTGLSGNSWGETRTPDL